MDCLLQGLQKGVKWDGRLMEEVKKFHQMKLSPDKTAQILSFLTCIDNDLITFVIPIRVNSVEKELQECKIGISCLSNKRFT